MTQANNAQGVANASIGIAKVTSEVTNSGAQELTSQTNALTPSLLKHQTGIRNIDGTNRADRKAVMAIRCGLVMSK